MSRFVASSQPLVDIGAKWIILRKWKNAGWMGRLGNGNLEMLTELHRHSIDA
jgi:hypothetical protein